MRHRRSVAVKSTNGVLHPFLLVLEGSLIVSQEDHSTSRPSTVAWAGGRHRIIRRNPGQGPWHRRRNPGMPIGRYQVYKSGGSNDVMWLADLRPRRSLVRIIIPRISRLSIFHQLLLCTSTRILQTALHSLRYRWLSRCCRNPLRSINELLNDSLSQ